MFLTIDKNLFVILKIIASNYSLPGLGKLALGKKFKVGKIIVKFKFLESMKNIRWCNKKKI